MFLADKAKDPIVLTYKALRNAVGAVALGLPFVLAIPWWVLRNHMLQSSISGYYYTGMRNLFVGSLCAIAMFMLCNRGYDSKDWAAGIFSAICALGVAFFPTAPDDSPTPRQHDVGIVHYTFAALLFLTLAYFCLVLFKMSAKNRVVTRGKRMRNVVYTVCGYAILASILMIVVLKFLNVKYLFSNLGSVFSFETTALLAFGFAWLTRGETFWKDEKASIGSANAGLEKAV